MSEFKTESDRVVAIFEAGRATRLDGVRRLPDLIQALTDLGYTEAQAKEAVAGFAKAYFKSDA